MKYTVYPVSTFENLVINAGVLLTDFNPSVPEVVNANILGATSGGINFTATPSFIDFGEDIDNVPKNTKELMRLDDWEVKVSGTLVAVDINAARYLAALADVSGNKLVPRDTLDLDDTDGDFRTIWLVADYSDKNTGSGAGFIAIKIMNALSTGGFQLQTEDKEKGKFSFELTGHYSVDAQDVVPFEIYIVGGTDSGAEPSIRMTDKTLHVKVGDTVNVGIARLSPAGATITWSSSATGKADVSGGVVTGVATGSAIITASITDGGVTYSDTCTVIVEAAS